MRKTARNFTKRTELARKDCIDGIALARKSARHFDVGICALRPLWNGRALGEETRLARKDAYFIERNICQKESWANFLKRNISPSPRHGSLATLRLCDNLASTDVGIAEIRAECGAPFARKRKLKSDGKKIATPLQNKITTLWTLLHSIDALSGSKNQSAILKTGANSTGAAPGMNLGIVISSAPSASFHSIFEESPSIETPFTNLIPGTLTFSRSFANTVM